jgi:hypothetical protein
VYLFLIWDLSHFESLHYPHHIQFEKYLLLMGCKILVAKNKTNSDQIECDEDNEEIQNEINPKSEIDTPI